VRLGPYRLLEEIAVRAVVSSWRAEHEELGRPAIVKTLEPAASPRSAFARALEREAAALGRLDHEGIVKLYDFERTGDGMWLALEDPGGFTLASVLAKAGRLDATVAAAVALGAARGLAHAHERGVVHGALSPRAIVLLPSGLVKLCELGSAHVVGAPAGDEGAAEVLERPDYMAPEQILGEPPSRPLDVFALGVVLYEMIAAVRPFSPEGAAPGEVARRIRTAVPSPLHAHVPDVPRPIERVALRCLAKRPEDRYASGSALESALEDALAESSSEPRATLVTRALAAAGLAPEIAAPDASPAPARGATSLRRVAPALRGLLLLFALLVGGVVAVELIAHDRAPPRGDGPTSEDRATTSAGPRGFLRVLVRPWAEVAIDGELVEVTPVARPLPVSAGRHYVVFRHPNAPDEKRVIDVAGGQTVLLDVTMRVVRASVLDAGASAPPAAASASP
jgi:serine/threonine-protein kinase